MKQQKIAAIVPDQSYELAYTRMDNRSGHWKKTTYRSSFSSAGLTAAIQHAHDEWQRCHVKYRHLSLTFVSLEFAVPWGPDYAFVDLWDPNPRGPGRRFFIRYRVYQTGISGTTEILKQTEIRADTLFDACRNALRQWDLLEHRHPAGQLWWKGLYEQLPWKPE